MVQILAFNFFLQGVTEKEENIKRSVVMKVMKMYESDENLTDNFIIA